MSAKRHIMYLSKHLALAATLSVGAYVGSEALAPVTGVSLAGQAHAQFTGKIKRIKIRKKRVGTGYKVVARTQGDDVNTVAAAQVTLSAAGEVLDTLDLGTANRARVDAIGDLTVSDIEVTGGTIINVQVASGLIAEDGEPGVDVVDSIIPIELVLGVNGRPRGEGVGENGWKARVRVNREGALVAVIMHENKAWQGAVDAISLLGEDGEPRPMRVQGVRQRRVATTEVDLEATGPVQVATTLFAEDGSVIDTRSEVVAAADETAPEVSTVKVRQTNRGDAKLVSITSGTGGDASLAVSITDAVTGEVALETVDDNPVSSVRTFLHSGLEFDPGASPAGYIYLCLIDQLDANGEPSGEQFEIELVVPEFVEGQVTTTVAPFNNGQGQVIMAVDAEGAYSLSTGVRGQTGVASVNLIFEEPFEGPAPLETEVNQSFSGQLDKWIQKGDGALPGSYTVSTTLTEGGVVVGGVDVGGEGTGTVYKNGKGTKKAAAQAEQQHFQLL